MRNDSKNGKWIKQHMGKKDSYREISEEIGLNSHPRDTPKPNQTNLRVH